MLRSFQNKGLEHVVLCPGSRSSPLALAVGGLVEGFGLNLYTSIDERSAAFLALGISAASGKAALVITTSGTAVANLLPAAVEADRSCHPIIFITADRPLRLKGCGANQTVNQEEFLKSVCRGFVQAPCEGIHTLGITKISILAKEVWEKAHQNPGPVHFNIPFEEPLHASYSEQKETWDEIRKEVLINNNLDNKIVGAPRKKEDVFFPDLDPNDVGIIIAGPWRGRAMDLEKFRTSLKNFQSLTNWPIFADPLSGVLSDQPGLINYWELLLSSGKLDFGNHLQILRLGPISSSRVLEAFLRKYPEKQVLITEGEKRLLDPIRVAKQYSYGLSLWTNTFIEKHSYLKKNNHINKLPILSSIYSKSKQVAFIVDKKLSLDTKLNQPLIVKSLSELIPPNVPLMISSSSLVRDFLTYSPNRLFSRSCFGFRGASGIDGNISMAMGLSNILGPLIHLCGDLAFLYDSNSFLLSKYVKHPLIILLIDNKGGGIFRTINLDKLYKGNLDDLFIMPQSIDIDKFASAHRVPYKEISSLDDLRSAIQWGLKLIGLVLIRVSIDSEDDNVVRKNIAEAVKKYIN